MELRWFRGRSIYLRLDHVFAIRNVAKVKGCSVTVDFMEIAPYPVLLVPPYLLEGVGPLACMPPKRAFLAIGFGLHSSCLYVNNTGARSIVFG
jgi:hypothetical protein